MRYLSDKMATALAWNSTMNPSATLKLADGTTKQLSGNDFCAMSVEQSSSSSGSFDIGAAVVGQLSCTLNNYDDRFSEYDFTGAQLTAFVGKALDDGTTERVQLGTFTVDQPDSYAGQISITALDNLSKFEAEFDPSSVAWPRTLQQLAQMACDKCGVVLATSAIPNGSYSVASQPDFSDATYLDLLGYIAQATGTFVRADSDGHVVFAWYDLKAFEGEGWLDGGRFDDSNPYASGDKANGGNFTDYSSGDSVDGGDFASMRSIGRINAFTSMTVFTDDVAVTGVRVTAANEVKVDEDGNEENGAEGETSLYGKEGYVLSIEGNPLVLYGQASKVAEQVGKRVVGMRFRPFSASCVTDPSLEPGDAVMVFDRKDNQYRSYITSTNLSVNGSESVECSAKSASRNSASAASAATKAIVAARNDLKREQTSRELALADLADKLSKSSGLFCTAEKQSDGSYIYKLHDKSDLASSKVVWKMTANAVAVSTSGDNEKSYVTGLTADGTAILNRIYAIGLDADYITTGALTVKKGTTTVFEADVDNGSVYIGGDSVKIGSSSLTSTIKDVKDDVSSLEASYGTCSTAGGTAEKTVSLSNFALKTGSTVTIKFYYANTASSPSLNINKTGAKTIYYGSSILASKYYWKSGDVLTFVYDGSYWQLADGSDKKNARSNWANDTTSVTLAAGTVTVKGGTMAFAADGAFTLDSSNLTVSSSGTVTANNFTANGAFTAGTTTGTGYGMTLGIDGCLHGYRNGTELGRLDPTAAVTYIPTGETLHGMQLYGRQIIREVSPHVSTLASSSTSQTSTKTVTGSGNFIYKVEDAGGGKINWYWETLDFINGRLVTEMS